MDTLILKASNYEGIYVALWSQNGLHVDPDTLKKMLKCAVQDYSYKGSIPSHPYFPEKYWLCPEEGRASPLTHSVTPTKTLHLNPT